MKRFLFKFPTQRHSNYMYSTGVWWRSLCEWHYWYYPWISQYELRILFPAVLSLFLLDTNVMFKNHIAIDVQYCLQACCYFIKYTPHKVAINAAEPRSVLYDRNRCSKEKWSRVVPCPWHESVCGCGCIGPLIPSFGIRRKWGVILKPIVLRPEESTPLTIQ